MFQLKTNFEITFTPLYVFGSNRKYGQIENQLHIDCKITHFSCKTNAAFILPSNEFQDSQTEREREPTHAPTNYTPLTHTHTNLISAPTHAPPSTPHIVRRQAPTTQPSQGQPRSCCPLCPDHAAPPRSHHDCTGSFAPRSHPLNLTAMLHRCMCLIHHRHHHPRHHPTYPPP